MTDEEIITMNIRIEGDVQGVGFRLFAIREATALRLKGWVRNRSDGSLEAVASGPRTVVERFITACVKGPRGARVTAFNLMPTDPPDSLGFTRRPSV
jgi:acylphosphatase